MTTTEYFPISPLGEGTIEIEAFGSLICRMSRAHTASIYALTTHLRSWWKRIDPSDDSAKCNVINAMNPMLCGIGPNVSAFTRIVSKATGCTTLERTTFLSLKNVIGVNGHALSRKGRAWCPACLDESIRCERIFYDRLIWAIPVMRRCPIHKVSLESKCPNCGNSQGHYHHLGYMDLCCKCKKSLRSNPSSWTVMLDPPLYERECMRLVEKISTGELDTVVENAYGMFIDEFADYLLPVGKKISRQTYHAPRRPQRAREATRPRFTTLLRRCAAFGVDPADLLCDPIGAAKAACLLEFGRLDLPPDLKPRKSVELVKLASEQIQSGLSRTDYDTLPSLLKIAQDLGVSKGFLNYQLGELCRQYARHRTSCMNRKSVGLKNRALAYLRNGPIKQYPSPGFPSHDHLVAAAVAETQVGVRIARIAADEAVREKLGRRAYQRYRKTNGLWKPRQSR